MQSELITIIKTNKRKLYRYIWLYYGEGTLYSDKEDKIAEFLLEIDGVFKGKYSIQYKRELKILYLAVDKLLKRVGERHQTRWWDFCRDRAGIVQELFSIHKRYWKRFHKYYFPGAVKKAGGHIPTMNKTLAMKEFLAMGFVHSDDFKRDHRKYCYMKANIGDLWWPENFEHHQDACQQAEKVGIQGLTGTTITKS
jgi:hypothetical protein